MRYQSYDLVRTVASFVALAMTDRGFRSNASISEIVGQIELEGVTGAVTFDTSLDRVTSQLALVNFDADEDAWRQVSQRPRGIKAESLFFRTVSIRNAIDFAAALCTDSAWGYQVAVWDARPPWVLNPLVATDLRYHSTMRLRVPPGLILTVITRSFRPSKLLTGAVSCYLTRGHVVLRQY